MNKKNTTASTKRHQMKGVVVSTKMNSTITIEVTQTHKHPLYKKIVRKRRRFAVHNELPDIAVGDTVLASEVRPVSKRVHFWVTKKI